MHNNDGNLILQIRVMMKTVTEASRVISTGGAGVTALSWVATLDVLTSQGSDDIPQWSYNSDNNTPATGGLRIWIIYLWVVIFKPFYNWRVISYKVILSRYLILNVWLQKDGYKNDNSPLLILYYIIKPWEKKIISANVGMEISFRV